MNYSKEELEDLILNQKISYTELGKINNCSGNNIKKIAKKLGIILPQRRLINAKETFGEGNRKNKNYCTTCGNLLNSSQTLFCSEKCHYEFKYSQFIINWKSGKIKGLRGRYNISRHIEKYIKEKYDNKCQKCGWAEINLSSNRSPLQIHHVDGDCLNIKEENLELLCPNCHSLTSNFGSLNQNSTRVRY